MWLKLDLFRCRRKGFSHSYRQAMSNEGRILDDTENGNAAEGSIQRLPPSRIPSWKRSTTKRSVSPSSKGRRPKTKDVTAGFRVTMVGDWSIQETEIFTHRRGCALR